jgi:ligand-binding sensor domain-containing protein
MRISGFGFRVALRCAAWAGLLAAESAFAQTAAPGDTKPAGATAAPTAPAAAHDLSVQISEYVRCVFQDQAGNLWFGTNSDGVCRYDGKALAYFNVNHGLGGMAVRDIVQSADGAIWFATEGGVSRYHLDTFTNYTIADGLSADDTWSMMLDRAGRLWVGTMGGVSRCDVVGGAGKKSFVPFPIPAAEVESPSFRFDPKLVWTMFEDKGGNIWFGTDGEGARKWDGKSFTTFTTKDGLAGNQVRCILGDRHGSIWLGAGTGGVSRYDGTAFRNFTPKDGLGNERVYTILEDRAGNLWFSTLGTGVTRYDGTTFTAFPGPLPRTHVQSMLEDKDGTLWFGISGGLFRLDGTSFVNVTQKGPWR